MLFLAGKKTFATNEPIDFELDLYCNQEVENFRINCTVTTMDDVPVGTVSSNQMHTIQKNECKRVKFSLINHNFAVGEYKISFSVGNGNLASILKDYDIVVDILSFQIDRFDCKTNEAFSNWSSGFGRIVLPYQTEILF